MAHWLTPPLSPRSIAIGGASERAGSLAGSTHRQLREFGFGGPIFSVDPKYERLHDDACYPGLRELPVVPDLVVYAISGLVLERSFDEAMALGVGGVVIYAANRIDSEAAPRGSPPGGNASRRRRNSARPARSICSPTSACRWSNGGSSRPRPRRARPPTR